MLTCEVCGTQFPPVVERHYIACDNGKTGFVAAIESNNETNIYDAFDCPNCGCQVFTKIRKRAWNTNEEEEE